MPEYKKRLNVLMQTRGSKVGITLRHVQVFFLLWHNQGGQRAAAEHIGLSQPAISAALASLESICGFELFHRGPAHACKPTNAGLRLYPYFDRAFRAMTDLTVEIEHCRTNPDFGLPFRTFRAVLEPLDKESTAADKQAKDIQDATRGNAGK